MTSPDPHLIVRRLSEAQRRALLWLPEDGSGRRLRSADMPTLGFTGATLSRLHAKPRDRRLVSYKLVGIRDSRGQPSAVCEWFGTPLGLAVREALKEVVPA